MREATFLKQNADTWKRFEEELKKGTKTDPDLLAERFIRITDDLAYARTYYPASNTTKYLNGLATRVHQLIYRNKKEKRSRFVTFWTYEVPMAAYDLRKQIIYSFIVFTAALLIGVVSMVEAGDNPQNSDFAKMILGDSYVHMTQENIKNGDPLGVYGQDGELATFLMIMFNNLWVDVLTFATGILTPFATGYILFQNGVMIGAFMYMFYGINEFERAIGGVMIHGTLELSTIVLAGAAGFAIGNSLLFPGTYTRMHALKESAKKGLKLLLGVFPVTVTAAILEGYVTRHYKMPIWIIGLIIVLSFLFIVWYFIIYPRIIAAKIKPYAGEDGAAQAA